MTDWRTQAACLGADTESIFFPAKPDEPRAYRIAKSYCDRCPVKQECADDILTYEASNAASGRHGYQAGMTPQDRAGLHRKRVRT